jgi:hypothetical protein
MNQAIKESLPLIFSTLSSYPEYPHYLVGDAANAVSCSCKPPAMVR